MTRTETHKRAVAQIYGLPVERIMTRQELARAVDCCGTSANNATCRVRNLSRCPNIYLMDAHEALIEAEAFFRSRAADNDRLYKRTGRQAAADRRDAWLKRAELAKALFKKRGYSEAEDEQRD